MYKLKIQKIGNGLGITLPKELLQQLNIGEGDTLVVTETADGVQMMTDDLKWEQAMKIYREGSQTYKNALRELAQ